MKAEHGDFFGRAHAAKLAAGGRSHEALAGSKATTRHGPPSLQRRLPIQRDAQSKHDTRPGHGCILEAGAGPDAQHLADVPRQQLRQCHDRPSRPRPDAPDVTHGLQNQSTDKLRVTSMPQGIASMDVSQSTECPGTHGENITATGVSDAEKPTEATGGFVQIPPEGKAGAANDPHCTFQITCS